MTESFTCPRCGRTTSHPINVEMGYCGACHDWTGLEAAAKRRRGSVKLVIELLNPELDLWVKASELTDGHQPGSISSQVDGEITVYMFGYVDDMWGVWQVGGHSVETGPLRAVSVDRTLLSDLTSSDWISMIHTPNGHRAVVRLRLEVDGV